MPNIVKTEGIVLKRMDFRETSRIVTFYSIKFGKIKLLAKGIRRPKSKFGSYLETFTHSAIVFYKREQKDLYTVSESDILESFDKLKKNLVGYGYASILLDFLDKASPGEGSNPRLYRLSIGTLKAMEKCIQMGSAECGVGPIRAKSEFEMLLWGFLWRGISFLGFKPELEKCVTCKTKINTLTGLPTHPLINSTTQQLIRWSSSLGGILCRDCWGRDEEAREISHETLNFLSNLKNGTEALTKPFEIGTFEETKVLIKEYLSYHLQKNLPSFDFLKSLQNLSL